MFHKGFTGKKQIVTNVSLNEEGDLRVETEMLDFQDGRLVIREESEKEQTSCGDGCCGCNGFNYETIDAPDPSLFTFPEELLQDEKPSNDGN